MSLRQKAERKKEQNQKNNSQKPVSGKTSAITTDIVILREIGGGIIPPPTLSQKATTGFEYIAAPINALGEDLLTLASVVKSRVILEYESQISPLNLVAITDGARVIRHRLLTIFDSSVTVILDWYYMSKKLRGLMSMIATNKLEKAKHLKFLFSQLWQGNTAIALEYLKSQVQARNLDKWQELIGSARKTST